MKLRRPSVAVVVVAALVGVATLLLVAAGGTNYASFRAHGEGALRRATGPRARQPARGSTASSPRRRRTAPCTESAWRRRPRATYGSGTAGGRWCRPASPSRRR